MSTPHPNSAWQWGCGSCSEPNMPESVKCAQCDSTRPPLPDLWMEGLPIEPGRYVLRDHGDVGTVYELLSVEDFEEIQEHWLPENSQHLAIPAPKGSS